jgi:hypothetical protein
LMTSSRENTLDQTTRHCAQLAFWKTLISTLNRATKKLESRRILDTLDLVNMACLVQSSLHFPHNLRWISPLHEKHTRKRTIRLV